jgi:hypothetical protein
MASREDVKVRRILGHLPSRAADNLFWLGRYLERTEATLRLVRALCTKPDGRRCPRSTPRATPSTGLQKLLIKWAAPGARARSGSPALEAARDDLHDANAWGSVIYLVRSAQRTASSMLDGFRPTSGPCCSTWRPTCRRRPGPRLGGPGLAPVENALQILPAPVGPDPGEHEPGRRLALPGHWRGASERVHQPPSVLPAPWPTRDAHPPTDLTCCSPADSQISYRARYLVGLALGPVRDMVMLDPYNTRSLAFQSRL